MGDRAMVVNAACVNQIDGSPNIVGGGGGADSYCSVRAALMWEPPMTL